MLDGWTNRRVTCKPCRPVRDPRPRTAPSERQLARWTLAGAISKPCGDISVAGMTELPPGTDHAVLVASVMAAVRGFTGYRGVPHLKVNWVGRYANGGPHANKVIPRPPRYALVFEDAAEAEDEDEAEDEVEDEAGAGVTDEYEEVWDDHDEVQASEDAHQEELGMEEVGMEERGMVEQGIP